MTRAAELLARFSTDFGVPFLLGHPCVVGDPLDGKGLRVVQGGILLDGPLLDACEQQVSQAALLTDVAPAPFDEEAGTLLYAIHELFAACHPQADSFLSHAASFCDVALEHLRALPPTLDAGRLLTRHLIVHRAFTATREDVEVKWWAGTARFQGQEAPRRLLILPELRHVQVHRETHAMWRLAVTTGDEDTRTTRVQLVLRLLDLSPLTRLMLLGSAVDRQLGFSLRSPFAVRGQRLSPIDVLEHASLARMVTDALLERGVGLAGPALAQALLQGLRENVSPVVLQRTAEFCVHLAFTMCLIESLDQTSPEAEPLRRLLDEDVEELHDSLRLYWAATGAWISLAQERFILPSDDDMPPAARPLWSALLKRLQHKKLRALSAPLVRELGRRLSTRPDEDAKDAPP